MPRSSKAVSGASRLKVFRRARVSILHDPWPTRDARARPKGAMMKYVSVQRLARLSLYALLAQSTFACGADTDRGPVIGPTGPIISEGGNSSGGASTDGANPGVSGAPNSTSGGALDTGGAVGAGADPFGAGGNGSDGAFGLAGSGTNGDRFGLAGTPGAFAGTPSF
jgi:hypothetical protein